MTEIFLSGTKQHHLNLFCMIKLRAQNGALSTFFCIFNNGFRGGGSQMLGVKFSILGLGEIYLLISTLDSFITPYKHSKPLWNKCVSGKCQHKIYCVWLSTTVPARSPIATHTHVVLFELMRINLSQTANKAIYSSLSNIQSFISKVRSGLGKCLTKWMPKATERECANRDSTGATLYLSIQWHLRHIQLSTISTW